MCCYPVDFLSPSCFGVGQIAPVHQTDAVHEAHQHHQSQINLATYPRLLGRRHVHGCGFIVGAVIRLTRLVLLVVDASQFLGHLLLLLLRPLLVSFFLCLFLVAKRGKTDTKVADWTFNEVRKGREKKGGWVRKMGIYTKKRRNDGMARRSAALKRFKNWKRKTSNGTVS
jgi:hypothetical protein